MQLGDVVGQRFLIEAIAGIGGMGVVYKATDHQTADTVALKVLQASRGDARERFVREIRALQALSHPAIVRYVADGTTPSGEIWLAMEWLEGEVLSQRL